MAHEDPKNDVKIGEDEKLKKENMQAAQAPVPQKSISTSLTCGRCGQKRVSYSQAQRSAEEPITTFCECFDCGNRWKFS